MYLFKNSKFYRGLVSILSFLLVINLCYINVLADINNVQTYGVDVTPPSIDLTSLQIDKKEAVAGDTIKVSLKASDDDSGISSIYLIYKSPITSKSEFIYLNYNVTTSNYEKEIKIDSSWESGLWKIQKISAYDNKNNYINVYDKRVGYGDNIYDLSLLDFNVSGTSADVTPPSIDLTSLQIDKKEAVAGDTIKVSLKGSDGESGISSIYLIYKSPITSKSEFIYLNYNLTTSNYEKEIKIDSSWESGLWKIQKISAYDNKNNYINVYDKRVGYGDNIYDLSLLDFHISYGQADNASPQLDLTSLSLDKSQAEIGDKVTIDLKATDTESGIKSIDVVYCTPTTGSENKVTLSYDSINNKYTTEVYLSTDFELGLWKIKQINLEDYAFNKSIIVDTRYATDQTGQDLSKLDFTVLKAPEQITPTGVNYIVKNESWSNKVINGDLYIGPQAVLTINGNVQINGNVYILGAMVTYGGLNINGTVYGRYMTTNIYSQLYNGTFKVAGGSNYVNTLNLTSEPYTYPFQITSITNNCINIEDGNLSITGSTVPVIDLYLNGNKIDYNADGTFKVNMDVSQIDTLKFEIKDIFNSTQSFVYTINNNVYDTDKNSQIDIIDISNLALHYNTNSSDILWNKQYDYNEDNIIDIFDLVKLSMRIS